MSVLMRLLAALPLSVGYLLARGAYFLLYHVFRYRRRVVRENLQNAFPDKSDHEITRIEKQSYQHFCNLVVEITRSTAMSRQEFQRRVRFTNVDDLAAATDNFEKQALILLIHQGNWEWMLHSAMATLPVPADPVYKSLHSPFWDQYMLNARSRFGAQPMTIANVGREVIRGRKRKRLIAMLADQAGPRQDGYWCNFLNRPASFYRGADKLAQALALPVVFAECRRLRTGFYEIYFHPISLPPHADESEVILERYVRHAETLIARQPETYLWTNRRWKKAPPEDFLRRQEHPD